MLEERKEFQELDIKLTQQMKEDFQTYYSLIEEWNKKIDITAIVEEEEVEVKHFLDSLTILRLPCVRQAEKVADIGTGGGFPGIPLRIVKDCELLLLDSLQKRIRFLDEVVKKLGLDKVTTLHGRAEDFAHKPQYRESYDLVVSRAVAALPTLVEYCIPYVKPGGHFVAMKGPNVQEELEDSKYAIQLLGGEIEEVQEFTIGDGQYSRTLVVVHKVKKTPRKYPRRQGRPRKEPLQAK